MIPGAAGRRPQRRSPNPLELKRGSPQQSGSPRERLGGKTSTGGPVLPTGCFCASSPLSDPLSLQLSAPARTLTHTARKTGLWGWEPGCISGEAANWEPPSRLRTCRFPLVSASFAQFVSLHSGGRASGAPRRPTLKVCSNRVRGGLQKLESGPG